MSVRPPERKGKVKEERGGQGRRGDVRQGPDPQICGPRTAL